MCALSRSERVWLVYSLALLALTAFCGALTDPVTQVMQRTNFTLKLMTIPELQTSQYRVHVNHSRSLCCSSGTEAKWMGDAAHD
jgi:hypothetical protein